MSDTSALKTGRESTDTGEVSEVSGEATSSASATSETTSITGEGTSADSSSSSSTGSSGDSGDSSNESESSEESSSDESSDFDQLGQCRTAGHGVFQQTAYTGTIDYILIGESGQGEELCRVQFAVHTIGSPEVLCKECYWSTVVELRDPQILTNVSGLCGNSERNLSEKVIQSKVGEQIYFGFAEEPTGHGDAAMTFDADTQTWKLVALGNWDAASGEVRYLDIEGHCRYP